MQQTLGLLPGPGLGFGDPKRKAGRQPSRERQWIEAEAFKYLNPTFPFTRCRSLGKLS